MNIPNIANQGSVGQTSDRASSRVGQEKTVIIPAGQRDQGPDRATISDGGRDTFAAVEGLAERARHQGGDRDELVAAALAKLTSGELSSPSALAETAQRIVDSAFLAE